MSKMFARSAGLFVVLAGSGLLALGRAWAQPPAPPPLALPTPEVTLPPAPAAATQVPSPLSLQQAIRIALERQPQVGIAQAQVQAAAGRTRQVRSNLGPSVGVSAQAASSGARLSGAAGGTATTNTYSTAIAGQQLIYDFGRTRDQVAQARSLEHATQAGARQTRQDVINQTKQAYYALLQDQRLVAVQQRNLDNQQAHLRLAEARLAEGTVPPADVYRAQTAVAEATSSLAAAQEAAEAARVNLNIALGVDVRTPTRVEETEEPAPTLDLPALVEVALANRPEVRQARFQVTAAEQALSVANKEKLPSVVAQADYGLRSSSFPPRDSNWSYGLSLQFPLIDSGFARGLQEQAKADLKAAQISLRQVEQVVGSEVASAYLQLQTAQQQLEANTVGVASAEENLRVATGRYEEGLGIYLDVIDAQAALLTAETNRVNALYGVSAARAALKRALGQEEG